jgi:hypothetical protein
VGLYGANFAGWNTQVVAAFHASRSAFTGERFGAIQRLVDEAYALIVKHYGRKGVPAAAILNLAGASVRAYAFGFCVAYDLEQPVAGAATMPSADATMM